LCKPATALPSFIIGSPCHAGGADAVIVIQINALAIRYIDYTIWGHGDGSPVKRAPLGFCFGFGHSPILRFDDPYLAQGENGVKNFFIKILLTSAKPSYKRLA
jgi:hypothetical protein